MSLYYRSICFQLINDSAVWDSLYFNIIFYDVIHVFSFVSTTIPTAHWLMSLHDSSHALFVKTWITSALTWYFALLILKHPHWKAVMRTIKKWTFPLSSDTFLFRQFKAQTGKLWPINYYTFLFPIFSLFITIHS